MYEYVLKSVVKPHKTYCQDLLNRLKDSLKNKEGISVEVELIGSGASNMVTRNGNEAFDLDFNIILISVPEKYSKSPGKIKDVVRQMLDSLIQKKYSYGQDSTSSITYNLFRSNNETVEFRLDLALIKKEGDKAYRLIHDKKQGIYIWNELPDYSLLPKKVERIKTDGRIASLRERYLQLKNQYLSQNDASHPSYVVYAEAVEDIYQKCESKEGNEMAIYNQQEKFIEGKEKMFKVIRFLTEMTSRDRYLYFTGEKASYYGDLSVEDCIKKYSMNEIETVVNQYLTDNLRLGDIVIRNEDGQEYFVAKYERNEPRMKKYKCLSLMEQKSFILENITEIKRTSKHIDYDSLRQSLR